MFTDTRTISRKHKKTLSQHRNKFSEIIVSGYNSDKRAEGVKTIYTDPPLTSIRNNTIQFQIHTTLNGLKICGSDFCLKHRSDEFYENLDPIINRIKNENKLISNNIFFVDKKYYSNFPQKVFSISDHLFGCKTKK